MQSFFISALLLAAFVAAGVAVIVTIRSRLRKSDADGDSWETTLAEYKNLRDKGVLTAEEYRKIRTLVEPRIDRGGSRPGDGEEPAPAARRVG